VAITVTKTLTATEQMDLSNLRVTYSFTLDAVYAETTSGWIKLSGLPASKTLVMRRYDMTSSVNNQVAFYNNDTTADTTTEIDKAGSATTYNKAPVVSGAKLDSGILFRTDANGCLYCAPNLASSGNITRLDVFITWP
jgi:hypothetical protein